MDAPKRDPTNVGCSHPCSAPLSSAVQNVKTGTPLKVGPDGYEVAGPDEEPTCYATSHATGGETVQAWRSLTIETHENLFKPGDHLDIRDIDDLGNIYFKHDETGPYVAVSESRIVLDVTQWIIRKGVEKLVNARLAQQEGEQGRDQERPQEAPRVLARTTTIPYKAGDVKPELGTD